MRKQTVLPKCYCLISKYSAHLASVYAHHLQSLSGVAVKERKHQSRRIILGRALRSTCQVFAPGGMASYGELEEIEAELFGCKGAPAPEKLIKFLRLVSGSEHAKILEQMLLFSLGTG